MDSNDRLHLATRIHFILLRELGSGIDVNLMLKRDLYALDVINVCRASDNEELIRLADLFVKACRSPEFAWSRTTGFGDSLLPAKSDRDSGFDTPMPPVPVAQPKWRAFSWFQGWSPLSRS